MVNLYKMLSFDEGIKHNAYLDTKGILTVGIGHNLIADPAHDILRRDIKLGDLITANEIECLFNRDLRTVTSGLHTNIHNFEQLKDKYKVILVNMCFNMGINRLINFKNTIACMQADNVTGVINGLLGSAYASQLPGRAKRMSLLAQGTIPKEYV